ncbi:DNA-binding transcriptional regulator, AcrR family [Amycolatopsis xylanica]|uniref:DNA-binding transcriptional regulator, AcrR family n=1 Tax=Amycolatopsis xylanica TaxID=589385 RepID=A0A1H3R120_9PSEU|nr:TetR/AcrR family transcriptional regulator [Amycolatopsis xylanica]SDZ19514.1 DNA-binding transcriptional regulator, AcrR family [Amycolatopsis xylanica]
MTGTRERIVNAGAELFRRNGYTGTGVKQIVAEAGAPFGSLYHFFPGGKEQLGEEVIRTSGMMYLRLFEIFFVDGAELVPTVEAIFESAAETLRETGYADACPIATVALEVASTNETLRIATADVFTAWIDHGAAGLIAKFGLAPERARELIIAIITSLEGAFVLSRALRSTEPLKVAGAAAAHAARAALVR